MSMRQMFIASMFTLLVVPIGLADNAALVGNATVILTFDDGWTNTYDTAKPILDNNDQKAVVFAITEPVIGGWGDYMTLDQLKTLYNNGWDISSHSYTHGSAHPGDNNYLIKANNSELKHELGDSKDWLDNNEFTRSSMFFSYPYGAYDDNLVASIKSLGYYVAARSVDAYSCRYGCKHPHYNIGDADVLKMATLSIDNTTYPLPVVLNEINKTISESGLLILTFHKIVTGTPASPEEYNIDDFTKISDYLKSTTLSGNVKVTTFSEYFKVQSPTPTPTSTSTPTPTPIPTSTSTPILTYMPSTPTISNTTGDSWILTQWEPGTDGNLTDLYDVNINGSWINDTTNTSYNATNLNAGSYILVNVYAVNTTNGRTINSTPATMNSTIPALAQTNNGSGDNNSGNSGSSNSGNSTSIGDGSSSSGSSGSINSGGSSGGSSSGGSGGGGGGGGSFYDNNTASYERRDLQIYNGTVSIIRFTKNDLISEVTVNGIKNYAGAAAVVSLLKNNPTNITIDNVYRFFSVKIETIKHENEQLFFTNPTVTVSFSKANISDKAVKVYKFTNGSWVVADMEELTGTDESRHFKLKLDGFSDFAVVFESKTTTGAVPTGTSESNISTTTQTGTEPKSDSGIEPKSGSGIKPESGAPSNTSLNERILSAIKNFLMRIFGR